MVGAGERGGGMQQRDRGIQGYWRIRVGGTCCSQVGQEHGGSRGSQRSEVSMSGDGRCWLQSDHVASAHLVRMLNFNE